MSMAWIGISGIPGDWVVEQFASQVDLFPTIIEAVGAGMSEADTDLPAVSLWPAISGSKTPRDALAEYHAMGSQNSGFTIRHENFKLIYHVDMPSQLLYLAVDPFEENDLLRNGDGHLKSDELEARLRQMLDPEAVDSKSKTDQAAHMEKFGGIDIVRKSGIFSRSPIPGSEVELEHV
tara:strand:- start:812 stop:1345 length:534 start_codon:yes stop_codon:yes gene_type:complete